MYVQFKFSSVYIAVTAIVFGSLRAYGYDLPLFRVVSHMLMGALFVYTVMTRSRTALVATGGLTILEAVMLVMESHR